MDKQIAGQLIKDTSADNVLFGKNMERCFLRTFCFRLNYWRTDGLHYGIISTQGEMVPGSLKIFMFKFSMSSLLKVILHTIKVTLLGLAIVQASFAETGSPVVRAVLFSSPTCSHCAKVREEVLPPLAARYGRQLQVVIVSTATPNGQELFLSACLKHGLLRLSVPLLVVGNTALVGADDIPMKFPGLIEKYMAEGGIDWPGIPGLNTMLAASPAFSSDVPKSTESPAEKPAAAPPVPVAMDTKPSAGAPAKPSSDRTAGPAAAASSAPPSAATSLPKPPVAAESLPKPPATASLHSSPTPNPRTSEQIAAGRPQSSPAAPSPPVVADASAKTGAAPSLPVTKE
jgi:hypothetical protein